MDDKLLAPALPAALTTDVPVLAPPVPAALSARAAMPATSATPALLPGGAAIGGAPGMEVQIGMADRTPWLAMAPAAPPRKDVSDEVGGNSDGVMPVARRARAGWRTEWHAGSRTGSRPGQRTGQRTAGPGEECGAGVCICGRCDGFPRRP